MIIERQMQGAVSLICEIETTDYGRDVSFRSWTHRPQMSSVMITGARPIAVAACGDGQCTPRSDGSPSDNLPPVQGIKLQGI